MAAGLSEHPVLIPTSQGPAGAIVCEPLAGARASLIFLHGAGRSGRSGFNSKWTRLARRLAGLGVTVLRVDLGTEGDSSMVGEADYPMDNSEPAKTEIDRLLVREVAAWFREKTKDEKPIVTGSCYGGRLSLELAAAAPGAAASLLIAPYLWRPQEADLNRWREWMLKAQRREETDDGDRTPAAALDRIDPTAIGQLESALRHGPSWILLGEHDVGDALALEPLLGASGLEVEVEPGLALYPGNDPDIQEVVSDRVLARVGQLLGGLS